MTVVPSIHTPLALKVSIIRIILLQEYLPSIMSCLVLILVSSPSVWAFGDEPWHNSANNQPEYCDNRQSHVHRRVDHLGKMQAEPWNSLMQELELLSTTKLVMWPTRPAGRPGRIRVTSWCIQCGAAHTYAAEVTEVDLCPSNEAKRYADEQITSFTRFR